MATVPQGITLQGMKIVVDCAHGAAYKVAPRILTDLGAEIVPIGCSPNGRNINIGCGAMAPELLQLTVTGIRADVGIALDGDGDRLVMVDHLGRKVDGDQLLYVIAMAMHAGGTLKGPVVGTLMTNLGLERALQAKGIGFRRAKVGDRYVLEMLRATGGVLGGETSGHLLTLDHATTGDAMVAALQVLAVMRKTGRPLAELVAGLELLPQQQIKVTVAERFDPETRPAIVAARKAIEARLADRGRIVLRASGTEPVIRVMVEADEREEADAAARELAAVVEKEARA